MDKNSFKFSIMTEKACTCISKQMHGKMSHFLLKEISTSIIPVMTLHSRLQTFNEHLLREITSNSITYFKIKIVSLKKPTKFLLNGEMILRN